MLRECFIMYDGSLLLFGLCMNIIGCVSINCYTLLKQTIFVGSVYVLKCLCYRGKTYHIYENDFPNGLYLYTTTNMTSLAMCSPKHMH